VLVLGRDTELVELVRRFTHAVERLRQTPGTLLLVKVPPSPRDRGR